MRFLPLLLVLAACTPAAPYVIVAPAPSDAGLDCAANRLTALGYTVRERNANAVIAVKDYGSGLGVRATAEVFTEAGASQLRVTSSAYAHGGTQDLGSTEYTRQDADSVLRECRSH